MTTRSTPPARLVVLISGAGSNLAAVLEAADDPGFGAQVVAVIADRECSGLEHARARDLPTAIVRLRDHADRAAWDRELAARIGEHRPDLVISAGFMKLLGPAVLDAHPARVLNTHPTLLPSFPGAHGVRDALAHGVKITGATVFVVDAGVDTGRILDQVAVRVEDDDTEETLHERIKAAEHRMLVDVLRRVAERPGDPAAATRPGPSPRPLPVPDPGGSP